MRVGALSSLRDTHCTSVTAAADRQAALAGGRAVRARFLPGKRLFCHMKGFNTRSRLHSPVSPASPARPTLASPHGARSRRAWFVVYLHLSSSGAPVQGVKILHESCWEQSSAPQHPRGSSARGWEPGMTLCWTQGPGGTGEAAGTGVLGKPQGGLTLIHI